MNTTITICICTRNRSSLLNKVLSRLQRIKVREFVELEIIVVDNSSTDDTKIVIERMNHDFNHFIRYVYEENLGLSFARNRGIKESKSEIIAFLDDDAIPRDGWLESIIEGFSLGDDVCVVGGQIVLAFPSENLPKWLGKPLHPYFSAKEIESTSIIDCNSISDFPFGANIAFRRKLFNEIGFFNPSLGRVGSKMFSGEETMLCLLAKKAGYRVFIHPLSIVDHYIPEERMVLSKLFNQAWCDGFLPFALSGKKSNVFATTGSVFINLLITAKNIVFNTSDRCRIVVCIYNLITSLSLFINSLKISDKK